MKIFTQPREQQLAQILITLLCAVAFAMPLLVSAATSAQIESSREAFRSEQWQRLAQAQDRDSLIAAVLIGMPVGVERTAISGQAELEQRLAKNFGHDPEALFTLALACQLRATPCENYYERLIAIAPNNAVHWLLLPNGAAPSAAQLHSAATAAFADTQLRMMVRVVASTIGTRETDALATAMRVDTIERVMLPKFGAVVELCKAPSIALKEDCIRLGRLLMDDNDGAILTKMVGGVMLRRLVIGGSAEGAAKHQRRQYVWLSEQLLGMDIAQKAQLQRDLAEMGEWPATQRAVERLGKVSSPAPEWQPKDPQSLLLPEQRSAN